TVARLLAGALGWQWLDAHAGLEERHGRTIRPGFAEEGEASFRDSEATILTELCQCQQHNIAPGGGRGLREENRRRARWGGRGRGTGGGWGRGDGSGG